MTSQICLFENYNPTFDEHPNYDVQFAQFIPLGEEVKQLLESGAYKNNIKNTEKLIKEIFSFKIERNSNGELALSNFKLGPFEISR